MQVPYIVLACRLNTWNIEQNPLSDKFKGYYLSPLHYGRPGQADQVGQWIESRFRHTPALGVKLRSKLAQPEQTALRSLVRNPQALTILGYVWEQWQTLPPTLNQLYANFVRLICGYQEQPIDPSDFTHEPLLQTAGILARYAIESSDPFRLPLSFIHHVFRVEGLNWEAFAQLRESTLLNLIGTAREDPDEEVYAFLHPMVQIYLAAGVVDDRFFLCQSDEAAIARSERIFNSQLLEMYLLWMGRKHLADQQRSLLQQLAHFDKGCEFYRYRAIFLAAAGLAEFYDPDLANAIVGQLREWLPAGMEVIRHGALSALHASQLAEAVEVLGAFAASSSHNLLCFQAIARLGRTKNQHIALAKAALVKLAQSSDLTIQFLAIESLVQLDPLDQQNYVQQVDLLVQTPTPFLIHQLYPRLFHPIEPEFSELYSDELALVGTPPFQARAAERLWRSLGKGNPVVIDRLIKYVVEGDRQFIVQNAAIGLGELGTGKLREVQALIELIDITTDRTTHDTAIASLKKYGVDFLGIMQNLAETGVETVANDQVVELAMTQLRALRHRTSQEQTAASSLEELQAAFSQVFPHEQELKTFFETLVMDWLQAEFNHEQRYKLQRVLSQLGQGDRVLIQICIEQLLRESTTSARWLGAFLLGDIGTGAPTEIAALEQFLQTESFKPVGRAAARSLAQLLAKQINAQQQLSQWLDRSPSEELEIWLAYQLGVSAPRANAKAIEHLVRLIVTSPAFADEFLYAERCYNFTNIVRQSAHQLNQLLSADCAELVVAGLSACLSDRVKQQEPERYRSAFELLWQCANLLAPAEFLAAWSSGTGGK